MRDKRVRNYGKNEFGTQEYYIVLIREPIPAVEPATGITGIQPVRKDERVVVWDLFGNAVWSSVYRYFPCSSYKHGMYIVQGAAGREKILIR